LDIEFPEFDEHDVDVDLFDLGQFLIGIQAVLVLHFCKILSSDVRPADKYFLVMMAIT